MFMLKLYGKQSKFPQQYQIDVTSNPDFQQYVESNFQELEIVNFHNKRLRYYYSQDEKILWIEVDRLPDFVTVKKGEFDPYYVNTTEIFTLFDNFESLGPQWTRSSLTFSVNSSILTITSGGISWKLQNEYFQQGYTIETKFKFDTTSQYYSGTIPSLASSNFTQSSNGNSDSTILIMRDTSSTQVKLWMGNGLTNSYNLQSALSLFNTVNNTWYISVINITGDKFTLTVKNQSTRETIFEQTFDVQFYRGLTNVSLGHFSGSGTVQTTSYDFIRIYPLITDSQYTIVPLSTSKPYLLSLSVEQQTKQISYLGFSTIKINVTPERKINREHELKNDFLKLQKIQLPLRENTTFLDGTNPIMLNNINIDPVQMQQYFDGTSSYVTVLPYTQLQSLYHNKNFTIFVKFKFTGSNSLNEYTIYDFGCGYSSNTSTSRVTGHQLQVKFVPSLNKYICYLQQYYFFHTTDTTRTITNNEVYYSRTNNHGELGITIPVNEWVSLQLQYNSQLRLLTMYVNGRKVKTIPFYNPTIWNQYYNKPLTLGQFVSLGSSTRVNFFEGYIKDFYYFDTMLSERTIKFLQSV